MRRASEGLATDFPMTERIVALLGRRDEPTDGVEEYCRYLSAALVAHGFELAVTRLPWAERGWSAALRELRQNATDWRGHWVFVQYTALAWSSRGFPRRFLSVLDVLRRANARVAVVYHDAGPFSGSRILDKLRRVVQLCVLRGALRRADLGIFTLPLSAISWFKTRPQNAVFIPVGANLPVDAVAATKTGESPQGDLRVAVFGITGGERGRKESARIA